jgi:hypothetical protein
MEMYEIPVIASLLVGLWQHSGCGQRRSVTNVVSPGLNLTIIAAKLQVIP